MNDIRHGIFIGQFFPYFGDLFLNFGDILRAIEMQNFQIVTPNWYKIESLKSSSNGKHNNKRGADDSQPPPKKSIPVINDAVFPACSLAPNEIFVLFFTGTIQNTKGNTTPETCCQDIHEGRRNVAKENVTGGTDSKKMFQKQLL